MDAKVWQPLTHRDPFCEQVPSGGQAEQRLLSAIGSLPFLLSSLLSEYVHAPGDLNTDTTVNSKIFRSSHKDQFSI